MPNKIKPIRAPSDTVKIGDVIYQVIRSRLFKHNGMTREALFLRRPKGRRMYQAVRYENGALSLAV